jgi:pilus assembly protein CpaE
MPKVLVIDDEPIYHKMIRHALKPLGYEVEFAVNGTSGLASASAIQPDVIITDVIMPDISGFEVTRRLRQDFRFSHTPILVLTSQTELGDKLKAFENGADDYLSKPFQPEELIARVGVLLNRSTVMRAINALDRGKTDVARTISIHSLRGGVGCSSLAINMAIGLHALWDKPTLVADTVLTAGQIALMLNSSLKRTWSNIAGVEVNELTYEELESIISNHDSGIHFIAAPTTSDVGEMISADSLHASLDILRPYFEYIVIDVPHDFSEIAVKMLDASDLIVIMIAPELASIRAAVAALDVYQKLGYPPQKVKLVLNHLFEHGGLEQAKIERALNRAIDLVLPFDSANLVKAINLGKPSLQDNPNLPISILFENIAFQCSKESHMNYTPSKPSETWKRVNKRLKRASGSSK